MCCGALQVSKVTSADTFMPRVWSLSKTCGAKYGGHVCALTLGRETTLSMPRAAPRGEERKMGRTFGDPVHEVRWVCDEVHAWIYDSVAQSSGLAFGISLKSA